MEIIGFFVTYISTDMTTQANTTVTELATRRPRPLTRAERETIAVAALTKKQAFAPGLFGYEREQQALMIVRVVLDAIEGGK